MTRDTRLPVRTVFAAALLACAGSARAMSLADAASLALQNDPRLHAAGDAVQASSAQVDAARAGYLPNATLSASTGLSRYYLSPALSGSIPINGPLNPNAASLQASQPLYTGGLTSAQVDASKNQLEGARQNEAGTRQQLLLSAASAYLDVERDRAVIDLAGANVSALQQELSDTGKRYQAGEATRTDTSQAQARLAEAQANLKRAIAQTKFSEAAFMRVVGVAPDALGADWPAPQVPGSLDAALASAGMTPAVLAADAQRHSADAQIEVARADYWPKVSLNGSAAVQGDSNVQADRYKDWTVQLKATLPLYTGGSTRARVAAARAQASQAAANLDDAHHAAIEAITQSWALLQASDELIRAYQADVDASTLALDDVRKELQAGTRTTKDVLDAERDKVSAQVNLAGSLHDRSVAAFQLLAACGKLRLEDVK
ncbi:MAG TPA: TolC family outer membrane protein [Nevskia sp.]|nr:TolC family outer membrane protein [Nevskia sp.]